MLVLRGYASRIGMMMHPAVIVQRSLGVYVRDRRWNHRKFISEARRRSSAKRKRCARCEDAKQINQGDQPPSHHSRRFSQTNEHSLDSQASPKTLPRNEGFGQVSLHRRAWIVITQFADRVWGPVGVRYTQRRTRER